MFESILSITYFVVALFYLIYGTLLLLTPHSVFSHIPRFFPLLASFRYHTLATSLNLMAVGATLLIIGKYISNWSAGAIFIALVLSGLEVYLGLAFYYREEHDVPQAIIHVVLHTLLVCVIGWVLLAEYGDTLTRVHIEALTLFGVY